MQMEKEMAELREERDLAQSRLEDIMRMVELDEASKVFIFPTISLYATNIFTLFLLLIC